MERNNSSDNIFKTPEGRAPKRRKTSEDGPPAPVLRLEDELTSVSPNSPKIVPDHSERKISVHTVLTIPECGNEATSEGSTTTTPVSTPGHSPRVPAYTPTSPSSPCESHHHHSNIHHAKLQVVKTVAPENHERNPLTHSNPSRRVGVVYFPKEHLPIIDALPKIPGKCHAIQNMLEAFGLLEKAELIFPAMASSKDLCAFHSEEYIGILRALGRKDTKNGLSSSSSQSSGSVETSSIAAGQNSTPPLFNSASALLREQSYPSSEDDNLDEDWESELDMFGLKDDCHPFPNLWSYVRLTAGATILASRYLIEYDKLTLDKSITYVPSVQLSTSGISIPMVPNNTPSSSQNSLAHSSSSTSLLKLSSESSTPPLPSFNSSTNLQNFGSSLGGHSPTSSLNLTPPTPPVQNITLAPVAIHWMGGRHHAKRNEASGFCYINDVVLGVLQLSTHFERIMYVDIDIHHGDGTEEAFKYSKQVLTISVHLHDQGFFPGSGAIDEVGDGKAQFYAINVPLKVGVVDSQYTTLFDSIIHESVKSFQSTAIVLVCGADCLKGDPLGGFNLSLHAVEHCVSTLLTLNLPLLILGGGGYHNPSAARLASIITATCLGMTLPDHIPPHNISYVDPGTYYLTDQTVENQNSDDYIKMVQSTVLDNLRHLREST